MNSTRVEHGLSAGFYTWDGLDFTFHESEQYFNHINYLFINIEMETEKLLRQIYYSDDRCDSKAVTLKKAKSIIPSITKHRCGYMV